MEKTVTSFFEGTSFVTIKVKANHVFFLLVLLCCMQARAYATAWKTAAAGSVNTLSNWTNGSTSPTTFATPGDTWTITLPMSMSSGTPWNVGSLSTPTSSVIIVAGGSITGSGSSFVLTMNIYGSLTMADSIKLINPLGQLRLNVFGNFSMTGGAVSTNSNGSYLIMNVNGDFSMTGGAVTSNGVSATDTVFVKGNFSTSGVAYISGLGAGATSNLFLSLPSTSGTMLIDNTSTALWAGTDIYVSAGCVAQLAGNFQVTTGGPNGFTVDGTLICPAASVVYGAGKFNLDPGATLMVGHATGINGAMTTTGTKTLSNSANYAFNGTAAQVTGSMLPASLISPDTISISNSAGVTLSQITATTGKLLFTAGLLNTGTFTMSVPGAATSVVGAGPASYVNGTLIKTISGLLSVTYEVGDITYAPMSLTLSTAGTAGSMGLKAVNGMHPSMGTSGLATGNIADHYWTITNAGAAGPATVTPVATYNAADILGGSNILFETQRYASAAWLAAPLTTTNTSSPYTSTPTAGIALASLAGDYIFGNKFCGTLPITGTTAFCVNTTSALSNATSGGSWTSSSTIIATVSAGGVVSGVSAGTATISYTNAGCLVVTTVTVNPCTSLSAADVISGSAAELKIFPNPNSGMFAMNLLSRNNEAVHVVITDIMGKAVMELNTLTNKPTDLKLNFGTGIYILSAATVNERYVEKVIVR